MAEAARVAEANFEVTPNELKITGTLTFSGQDSSDFRAYVDEFLGNDDGEVEACLLYTSPSPRDRSLSRMPSSA